MSNSLLHILLCDDDDDDSYLFQKALSVQHPAARLTLVENGEALMCLLRQMETFPDVLFLDLNMPCKNGFECLNEIRSDEKFRILKVIIMSTTNQEEAIVRTYNSGADLYIIKPLKFDELVRLIAEGISFVMKSNTRCARSEYVLNYSKM